MTFSFCNQLDIKQNIATDLLKILKLHLANKCKSEITTQHYSSKDSLRNEWITSSKFFSECIMGIHIMQGRFHVDADLLRDRLWAKGFCEVITLVVRFLQVGCALWNFCLSPKYLLFHNVRSFADLSGWSRICFS